MVASLAVALCLGPALMSFGVAGRMPGLPGKALIGGVHRAGGALDRGTEYKVLEADLDRAAVVLRACQPWQGVPEERCPTSNIHNLCDDLPDLCRAGKYRRCEMPQIPDMSDAKGHGAWLAKLDKEGIEYDLHKNLTLKDFIAYKPAQSQLDSCLVCGILFAARKCVLGKAAAPSPELCSSRTDGCFCAWSSGVSVSGAERRILDGHHRWAATLLLSEDQEVLGSESRRSDFLAQEAKVQSYEAPVEKLITLSRKVEAVDEKKCGSYAKGQTGGAPRAPHMPCTLVWSLLGFLLTAQHWC